MKKGSLRLGLAVGVSVLALLGSAGAFAAYGSQGLFGGRSAPDGAVNGRNPVAPVDGLQPGVSVAAKARPEFDPVPITVGSFQMFPSIEVGGSFDGNVYARKNDRAVDFIWTARPGVVLFSNWSRHALALTAQGDFGAFTNHGGENFYNGAVDVHGRFDVVRRTWINYGAEYQRLTESRGSPDTLGSTAVGPTRADYVNAFMGAQRGQGKFDFRAKYSFSRFDYHAVDTKAGGKISQDFRDRDTHEVSGEVGYDLMRFWRPFVRASYNWRDYDSNAARTSAGYAIVAGTGYELSGGIITGEIFAGSMKQDFKNWAMTGKSTGGLKFGGDMLWILTGMTSLQMEIDRTVDDTTNALYRSFTSTGGSATLTHELRRNVLLEGNFEWTRTDFNGAPDRSDDTFRVGPGMRYDFTRHVYGSVDYSYTNRTSNLAGVDYARHVINMRLGAQM